MAMKVQELPTFFKLIAVFDGSQPLEKMLKPVSLNMQSMGPAQWGFSMLQTLGLHNRSTPAYQNGLGIAVDFSSFGGTPIFSVPMVKGRNLNTAHNHCLLQERRHKLFCPCHDRYGLPFSSTWKTKRGVIILIRTMIQNFSGTF